MDGRLDTTEYIHAQEDFGKLPYGSRGSVSANGCGAVSAHNVMRILGAATAFADVYAHFNDDRHMLLRRIGRGRLGTNPSAIVRYLRKRGRKVRRPVFVRRMGRHKALIFVYRWRNKKGDANYHFKAVRVRGDGRIFGYNETGEYENFAEFKRKSHMKLYYIIGVS